MEDRDPHFEIPLHRVLNSPLVGIRDRLPPPWEGQHLHGRAKGAKRFPQDKIPAPLRRLLSSTPPFVRGEEPMRE